MLVNVRTCKVFLNATWVEGHILAGMMVSRRSRAGNPYCSSIWGALPPMHWVVCFEPHFVVFATLTRRQKPSTLREAIIEKKSRFYGHFPYPPQPPPPQGLRMLRGVFFLKARTSDSRRLERKTRKLTFLEKLKIYRENYKIWGVILTFCAIFIHKQLL